MEKDTLLKRCSKCNRDVSINNFYHRNRVVGGPKLPISYCIDCHKKDGNKRKKFKALDKDYIIKEKNKKREYNQKLYSSNKELIDELKTRPCADCGIQYESFIMEFDHVKGDKKFNISDKIRGLNIQSILEEIKKCDVVCCNCHRRRTHILRNSTAQKGNYGK